MRKPAGRVLKLRAVLRTTPQHACGNARDLAFFGSGPALATVFLRGSNAVA